MRELFIPDQDTYNGLKKVIQSGGGFDEMGYIYNIQKGSGLGSFFKNLLKIALPVTKRLLTKGVTIAKPHLQRIAQEGIAAATDASINSIKNYSQRAQRKVVSKRTKSKRKGVNKPAKKRKIDQLS